MNGIKIHVSDRSIPLTGIDGTRIYGWRIVTPAWLLGIATLSLVGCAQSRSEVADLMRFDFSLRTSQLTDEASLAATSRPQQTVERPATEPAEDFSSSSDTHKVSREQLTLVSFPSQTGTSTAESENSPNADGATDTSTREAGPAIARPAEEPLPPAPAAIVTAPNGGLTLNEVISSVYQSYPELEGALYSRNIASGEQLAASGAFDLKLKAASENGPTGFYRSYRQSIGLIQPLYSGGEFFAGYRIGRGTFEPWYQERKTNDGGEFKAGVLVPLSRNREIDDRRAELWRETYGRQLVEPEIRAQLIEFVLNASNSYWEWVAAGERYRITEHVLELAENRTERIKRQVEEGLLDPPELTDNLRLVAERKAKLAESTQKLQKAAIKLSLYFRDANGQPVIPSPEKLPEFPRPMLIDAEAVAFDSQLALQQRPEIEVYTILQRQLEVDYAQAHNDFRPAVDAVLSASQDTGLPTSSKNDKGEFELDASIFVELPIQRRKARGKMQAVLAKISQLNAKMRITEDKIVSEVQMAYASLVAAYEQVQQADQAVAYAEDLAERERLNLELGLSDLLKVTLREQYAVESEMKSVDALLIYFKAQADYRAALAQDRLPE